MSSSQLTEWMGYASLEPFGEYRHELRHGQMMALHCNINRDSTTNPDPYRPADFMNFIDTPKPTETSTACDWERIDREIFGL